MGEPATNRERKFSLVNRMGVRPAPPSTTVFICALGSCYHRGQPRWSTWGALVDHLLNVHQFKREGERMVRR